MMFARPPRSPRGLARAAACLGACAGLLALAACSSSPPSHFYTLGADNAATTTRSAAGSALLIEVAPVGVPSQVQKNQLVVQNGSTQVQILEQERWASLPGDEIRRALSSDLTQQLGTIDVYGTAYPESTPVYRVSVNVQRFESWPGSHALIDAVWSVRAVRSEAVMTCRSTISAPVTAGYDALVDGHRQAVQQISSQIAASIEAMAAAAARVPTGTPAKNASGVPARMAPAAVPCPLPSGPSAALDGAGGLAASFGLTPISVNG
jgi:uncharacterized lipoprotein YmbA